MTVDVMPAKPELPDALGVDDSRPWTIKNVPEIVRTKAIEAAARNGETQGEFVTRALVELIKERPRSRDLVPLASPVAETPAPGIPVEELRTLGALAAEMNGGTPPRSITRKINLAIRTRLDEVLKSLS